MDEDKYRETYHSVNPLQCPFEKTLNSRRCICNEMDKINLADRECVGCKNKESWQNCLDFLEILRSNAKFALKLTEVEEPLPHGKEIKVQNGGVIGLQKLFTPESEGKPNISQLINQALEKYQKFENLPLDQLMQSIVHFKARATRKDKKK
ncbi:MAG: hypothetical protein KAT06_09930 [Gammaproteobacteria bacterium]|nr:hypothetical protein [Gammaproteobacteria bacterium]